MLFIVAGYVVYAGWRCRLRWLAMPVALGGFATHAVYLYWQCSVYLAMLAGFAGYAV
jgi:hypothetical protein